MTLSVACLGAGYFAQFHHDAWRRLTRSEQGVKFRAVCDQNIEKAQMSGVEPYDDLTKMLQVEKPDIVDIATPPPSHVEAVELALSHQPKAIICQKPFTTSLDEARHLVELASKAGVALIVHENFRFQPWYRTIKTAMDTGKIGTPMQVSFRLRTGDGQGPDAYLDRQPYFQDMPRLLIHETGIHFVDVFSFLMGQPRAVYGDLRRLNPAIKGEDAGYFTLDFEGGARALFDGNRLLDHDAENTRTTLGEALIEGTHGTITLHGDGSVMLRPFGQRETTTLLAAQDWQSFGGDCVVNLCTHVVEGVQGDGQFENEARDYLRVMETVEAIYASDKRGQKIEL